MRWPKTLLLLVALAVTSCDSSNDEAKVELAPLKIESTVPADALADPYVGVPSLEVNFNRGAASFELRSWMIPNLPAGNFVPKSETGRSWTWTDLEFVEEDGCYYWLIDGTSLGRYVFLENGDRVFLREPGLVQIPSSADRKFSVGFEGRIQSSGANVLAGGTLIFVLPVDSGFNPLQPETFDPTEAIGLAVASADEVFPDLDAQYWARFLPADSQFVAVAVKDTNDDLHYSLLDDWWGIYEVDGEPAGVWARENTGEKGSPYNLAVNITLFPPTPAPELPGN